MKVDRFIKKFTITSSDIVSNLSKTKTLDIDTTYHKGCYNCNDSHNNIILESEPWTIVQYCWRCNHINITYVTDRMGGGNIDRIDCYTDKLKK